MLEKIAKIIGKMNGTVLMFAALGIVAVVFIIGLIMALGGDLARFKSAAKLAISKPVPAAFNESAKKMPIRVRKLYKKAKQTGEKPSDVIGIDACVYDSFAQSAAAKFPNAVMAAGVLAILFAFFAAPYAKKADTFYQIIPLVVTAGAMLFRLLAGLIAMGIQKSAVGVYNKYVEVLDKNLRGGAVREAEEPVVQATAEPEEAEAPIEMAVQTDDETPVTPVQNFADFGEPERITVELADDEPAETPVREETIVMQAPTESEEEIRARARAEAIAAARAEAAARAQAQAAEQEKERAEAAARAHAEAEARARAEAEARAKAQAEAAARAQAAHAATAQAHTGGSSSADEVIARIEKINQEGANLATMKEVALQLQRERAKPENKTPEMQRKLNEALASLLKAMSSANKR